MNTTFIYAVLDPATSQPVYVGASKDMRWRMYNHWTYRRAESKAGHRPLYTWLRTLSEPPPYRLVAQVAYADRFKWERFYTDRLRERGCDLLNIRSGGMLSPDEFRRFSNAAHTPEAHAKAAAKRRGRYIPLPSARGDNHWSRKPENKEAVMERAALMRAAKAARKVALFCEQQEKPQEEQAEEAAQGAEE